MRALGPYDIGGHRWRSSAHRMPDRWVSFPERAPYKCAWTHVAEEAAGPYYEARQQYFPALDDGGQLYPGRHPHQLYLSGQAIKEACDAPGSPLVCLSREQYGELEQRLLEANEQITSLLDDAVERDRRDAALDPVAIAEEVAKRIREDAAKKPGPKAKDPEMSRR